MNHLKEILLTLGVDDFIFDENNYLTPIKSKDGVFDIIYYNEILKDINNNSIVTKYISIYHNMMRLRKNSFDDKYINVEIPNYIINLKKEEQVFELKRATNTLLILSKSAIKNNNFDFY